MSSRATSEETLLRARRGFSPNKCFYTTAEDKDNEEGRVVARVQLQSVLQWISQLHLVQRELRSVCKCQIFKMQRIYMHSNEHFEVFTTVLAPQGRYRYRAEAETMVVVHGYRPHWPDELELTLGDVILVLPKHEEERWFGRLLDGQQGYFPASCVMELSQVNLPPKALKRSLSLRSSACNDSGVRSRHGNGHIRQALRRGSRGVGGGGGVVLDGGQGENEGPFPVRRHQISVPQPVASQPQTHRSPGLLHRILSKCRKKSECQGATNGAFEGD